jgi:hypothetical protein
MSNCALGDPFCPCPDGGACRYVKLPDGTLTPMAPPSRAEQAKAQRSDTTMNEDALEYVTYDVDCRRGPVRLKLEEEADPGRVAVSDGVMGVGGSARGGAL